jgi:hypothetical protein
MLSLNMFHVRNASKDGLSSRCKSCIKKSQADYRARTYTPEKRKEVYLKHFNKQRQSQKLYYENNKSKCRLCNKTWQKNNKDKYDRSRLEWTKNKRATPEGRIEYSLRTRMYKFLKNNIKYGSTLDLVGCSYEFLRGYIESKFIEGMNWDNYGKYGWHIDHIKPCSLFDLLKEEDQKVCFHYTNLQPLWAKDNLSKGAKYNA